MIPETETQRHVAIRDGAERTDMVLAERSTIADALKQIGVEPERGTELVVLTGDGHQIALDTPAIQLDDGAVLSIIDPAGTANPTPATSARGAAQPTEPPPSVGWLIGAAGLLLAAIAILTPEAIPSTARVALVAICAIGSLAAIVPGALRTGGSPNAHIPTVGPIVLMFAAGAVSVPELPASGADTAIFVGFAAAATLAGILALLVQDPNVRAQASVTGITLATLAAFWGATVLLGLTSAAPCAITVGIVPVILRALPAMLLDVPPGAFIDFPRFQSLRWSVREQLPQPINTVDTDEITALVKRSATKLSTATLLLSGIASAASPWALAGTTNNTLFVTAGRIALASCVALGLILGTRRSSDPILQWVPRAAGMIVAAVGLCTLTWHILPTALTLAACAALAGGIIAGFITVPIARGARSLFWSRFGDLIENLAIVLAVPAGLLAANILEILRGATA